MAHAIALLVLFFAGAAADGGPPCTFGTPFCQQHLAVGPNGNMRVSWVSGPADPVRPTLQWAVGSPTDMSHASNASTETYKLKDLCTWQMVAVRGWESPGSIHHATMSGFKAGDRVWYRVGDASRDEWGNITGPITIGPKRGTRLPTFAAFGDMGAYSYTPPSAGEKASCHRKLSACPGDPDGPTLGAVDDHTAASLTRIAPELDAVVHVGDLAYANDGPAKRWRYWMTEIEPIASRVPWMVACGNHDCLYRGNKHAPTWPESFFSAGGDGGECGIPMGARFWMPGNPQEIQGWHESNNGEKNNVFYSFDMGTVHFALVSSEHDLRSNSTQVVWLERDLASVDRQTTPFIVVGLHRPLYTSSKGGGKLPETTGMREAIEPLLLKYKVTAAVAGHYHQYERSCPLAEGKCVSPGMGPVYITAGSAGVTHNDGWMDDTPAWVAKQNNHQFGYARFDVENDTHIHVRAIDSGNDTAFDDFWIQVPPVIVDVSV